MTKEDLLGQPAPASAEPPIHWAAALRFMLSTWRYMLAGAVLGALVVAAYVAFVPARFEATAMVRMAQVPVQVGTGGYARQNVEPPALLHARLRTPSVYPPAVLNACGISAARASGEQLVDRLRLTVPPAQAEYVVSIAFAAADTQTAKACADAIVELVRQLQADEGRRLLGDLNRQLGALRTRLADNRTSLASLEKTQAYQTAFLAQRDELNYLSRRIEEIESALALATPAQLIAPVHASAEPVFPRHSLALVAMGAVIGALVGFLLAGVRRARQPM